MKKQEVAVETKAVETKKVAVDYKALAEGIEKAFAKSKDVDVVADTKQDDPKALSESDYRYIHFYKAGTEKNLFGCYLIGKQKVRFALNLAVEEFLDKDLEVKPVIKAKKKGEEKRKIAVDVICDIQDAAEVAKKIITAYQQIPGKAAKAEKKAETKEPAAKTTTKKKSKTA